MNTISFVDIEYTGSVSFDVREKLDKFSYEFEFGKIYLLDSNVGEGGWAIVEVMTGTVVPQNGYVLFNGEKYSKDQQRKICWYVRHDQIKRFGFLGQQSTRWQIETGIKKYRHETLNSLDDYVSQFRLTPSRLDRPYRHLSAEAWRAGCAIGLANGRKIFCFPQMQFMRPDFDEPIYRKRFGATLKTLKNNGALVILPILVTKTNRSLGDVVVTLN
jgi:ABC-type multidrug transport system ATPase subunit